MNTELSSGEKHKRSRLKLKLAESGIATSYRRGSLQAIMDEKIVKTRNERI